MIIRREDLPRLEAVMELAERKELVVYDLMSGRHDALPRLLRLLRADPAVFGDPVAGSPTEPGVTIGNVHQLLKTVAGLPNPRPAWYFDITAQGEGLADTATHLVDRVHETLFPDAALDYRRDIAIDAASRWPTLIAAAQFSQITGEAAWPAYLQPWIRDDTLEYFCNGRADYRVRGIHLRIEARWEWQTAAGDDTHTATLRGSRARLELRQGAAEHYRATLYVVPEAEIAAALERRIAAAQREFPGVALDRRHGEWRVVVPDALRPGHDANFAALTRRFLTYVQDPGSLPRWHKPNLLAKYFVTTGAVALSHQ